LYKISEINYRFKFHIYRFFGMPSTVQFFNHLATLTGSEYRNAASHAARAARVRCAWNAPDAPVS